MGIPTAKDDVTGVPVSRLTSGAGVHLLPYYTARCLSADGQWVCCTRRSVGPAQAWVIRMADGEGHADEDDQHPGLAPVAAARGGHPEGGKKEVRQQDGHQMPRQEVVESDGGGRREAFRAPVLSVVQ